jgi:hypothetical protein
VDESQEGALELPPPLSLDEAQRIIARLEEVVREQRVVLIGGQAVSIWIGPQRSTSAGRPVTSIYKGKPSRTTCRRFERPRARSQR